MTDTETLQCLEGSQEYFLNALLKEEPEETPEHIGELLEEACYRITGYVPGAFQRECNVKHKAERTLRALRHGPVILTLEVEVRNLYRGKTS